MYIRNTEGRPLVFNLKGGGTLRVDAYGWEKIKNVQISDELITARNAGTVLFVRESEAADMLIPRKIKKGGAE